MSNYSRLVATATDIGSQLQCAATVAGRNLTWDEWIKAGIGKRYRPTFASVWVGADVIAGESANLERLAAERGRPEADRLKQDLLLWTRQLDDAESCNDVAWELLKQGQVADALALSTMALQLIPDDPNFHDTNGVALALAGSATKRLLKFCKSPAIMTMN